MNNDTDIDIDIDIDIVIDPQKEEWPVAGLICT